MFFSFGYRGNIFLLYEETPEKGGSGRDPNFIPSLYKKSKIIMKLYNATLFGRSGRKEKKRVCKKKKQLRTEGPALTTR